MLRLSLEKKLNLSEVTESQPKLATLCLRDAEVAGPPKTLVSLSTQEKSNAGSTGACYKDSNQLGPENASQLVQRGAGELVPTGEPHSGL